jgi:hypothetical protein
MAVPPPGLSLPAARGSSAPPPGPPAALCDDCGARRVLGWPKRCKWAHAFLWEGSFKRLEVGPTSEPTSEPFTLLHGAPACVQNHSGAAGARRTDLREHVPEAVVRVCVPWRRDAFGLI